VYYELSMADRLPLWRLGLFALAVVGLHLVALWLALTALMPPRVAELVPVLSVRVLDPLPVVPPSEAAGKVPAPPKAVATARSSPPALPRKAPSPPLSTPIATPPVAPAVPALAAVGSAGAPPAAPAVAAAAPAPAALVAARFDADYLDNPGPVYPAASRRLGEAGRVILRVRVSTQGLPLAVDIRQSSGFSRLDEAARAAVEHWRFVPARQAGEAVDSSVLVPLQFVLEN
jgi:protein TonB